MYKNMGLIQFIFKCFFDWNLIKANLFGLKYIKTVTLWISITIYGKAEFYSSLQCHMILQKIIPIWCSRNISYYQCRKPLCFSIFFCGNKDIFLQISLNSSKDSIYLNSLKQKTVLDLLNIKYTSKNVQWAKISDVICSFYKRFLNLPLWEAS